MKQTAVLLWVLLTAAPAFAADEPASAPPAIDLLRQAVAPGAPEGLPLPPREKIEKPYTNDKCLEKCHGVAGFAAGDKRGLLRNLHVDKAAFIASTHAQKGLECVDCHQDADPNFHPRTGYPRVDCRACHSQTPPPGIYPPNALERLKAKGIKPPPKESQNGESWMKTVHAKAWSEGKPEAPFCSDCHTAHAIRRSKDPAAPVHRENLARTCGKCHPDQVRPYGVGGLLARFRIAGHGKGDLANRYDVSECVSCHQGEAAHGEETVTKQACPRCHTVPPKEERQGAKALTTLHVKPQASDQPSAQVFGWAYTLIFWGAVASVVVVALFMGFSTLYRKDGEGGERKD
jgi:hypothetical protein